MSAKKTDWQEIVRLMGYRTERGMWNDLYIARNESPEQISLTITIKARPISYFTIYNRLRELDYKISKSERFTKIHSDFALSHGYTSRADMLTDMYIDQDMSSRDIAHVINRTSITVLNWLRADGIKIKPKGGARNFSGCVAVER